MLALAGAACHPNADATHELQVWGCDNLCVGLYLQRNRCVGMRTVSSTTAQLLRSVAGRYQAVFPRRCPLVSHWPLGQLGKSRAIPKPEVGRGADAESDSEMAKRLEAVLFLAKEPLSSRKLAQLSNLADGTQARTLIRWLNESYDAAGRAFRIEAVAGGYQLLTRRKFSSWLRRLAHVPGETRLSAPALETLAVIAYRQPVLKADIEAIRGVHCGEVLRQLMERDLVRISGRSTELGRPFLYGTTRRFLNLFGLHSVDELPRADEIGSAPVVVGPLWPSNFQTPAETPSGQNESHGYTGEDDSEWMRQPEPADGEERP
jgi:segregation and condensation protein B